MTNYDLSKSEEKSPKSDELSTNGKFTSKSEMNGHVQTEDDGSKDDKNKETQKMVGVLEVFRFADGLDVLLMIVGTICACCHGAAMPMMMIVFGSMSDMFIDDAMLDEFLHIILPNVTDVCPNITSVDYIYTYWDDFVECLYTNNATALLAEIEAMASSDMLQQMQTYAIYYAVIGTAVLGFAYVQIACWDASSHRQSQRIRIKLFWSILRQEIGWFDTHEAGELNTRLSDDVNKIQDGIGEKLALFFQFVAAFVTGFVIGFVYGWELTLVILSISPLLALSAAVIGKIGSSMTAKELKAYAKAGAVAEEVLGSIRTVTAFGGQKKECSRYNSNLQEARDFGIKKGTVNGGSIGIIFFIMFSTYALAFWYGSDLVRNNPAYTGGDILVVFFCVLTAAFSIGNAAPNVQYFATARGAAYAIYQIIDNQPLIDSSSEEGLTPSDFIGNIEFRNIVFQYPSRPDVPVLRKLDLKVEVGQTVALVGSSGCGKSTTVQLIQRFYDPIEGEVLIGGHNIRDLNLKWLRQRIGVVSQEPILFATTIAENIRYGREGVTDKEIEAAAQEANAHNFIMELPKKYETLVGERGAQLSGGQKQRIAIARALIKNPKIILLDEATSALDTESEATVQAALDKARMGRTTIVIAHRLSTVRTADTIASLKDGVIVELGTHEELMKCGGVYHQLVTNQTKVTEDKEDDDDEEEADSSLQNGGSIFKKSLSYDGSKHRADSVGSEKDRHRATSVSSSRVEEEVLPDPPIKRIISLNSPEWPYIVLGCIGAIVSGCIQPTFAVVFAEILGVFSQLDLEEQQKQMEKYCVFFVVLGVVAGTAMFLQSSMFSRSGEYLTLRLRKMAFYSMMRQEVAFYDDEKNNTGALCTRLATDASAVQGATGSRFGSVLQSFAGMTAGLIIGFIFSWKLSLVMICFAPFMMLAGFLRMRVVFGKGKHVKENELLENAGKVATESIENIRTVASLTKEVTFYDDYVRLTAEPNSRSLKASHLHGLSYGFSQGIMFYANAACFSYGAYLVDKGELEYQNMFKVFSAILFGAMSVGQASSFAPDYGKAKAAAARLFSLFDKQSSIDNFSEEGAIPESVQGSVELKNVFFNYPTRPKIPVLRGLNVTAKTGKMIALVGSSGCGKSTVVGLLERFYDPLSGEVRLDNQETKTLHIQGFRSYLGIVSQEPILFGCSIRDNIAYGDNSREIPMEEIIEAAKMANIHNFISTLPNGYETNVGDKGTQLSGGQKQRVAIARALIRNPKVLLLDEATSALDTESEKVVQEALDKAQQGRTSIVIAHRLSTIQNADCILVIQRGRVTEMGKHNELLAQNGFYYKLNNTQVNKT